MAGYIRFHLFQILITLLILISIVNCPEILSKANTGTCFPICRALSSTSVVEGSCQCSRFSHPTGCKCPEKSYGKYPECLQDQMLQKLPFCNESSGISVPSNTCKCIDGYTPVGCNCSNMPDLLGGIPKEICPCLAQGDDIRGGNICPVTRFCGYKDKLNTHCFCSSKFSGNGCTCTQDYFPDGCICDTNPAAAYDLATCLSTKPCNGGTFTNPTPAGCTPINCQSKTQSYKCKCKPGKDPFGCVCPSDPQDLAGISPQSCACQLTEDPRAGSTCPVTEECESGVLYPILRGCFCTSSYQPIGCTCPASGSDLAGISTLSCPCRATEDIRAGSTCPVTEECSATLNPSMRGCFCTASYQQAECTCPVDSSKLTRISTTACECRSTADPRADGTTCPYYCTGPDQPNANCVCDTGISASYPLQQCQKSKVCTGPNTPIGCTPTCAADSGTTVTLNSCFCTNTNYPTGCRCPIDSSQLAGIPSDRCACRDIDDPRAGSTCKVTENCISGILDPSKRGCFCTASYQLPGCTCTSTYSQDGCVCDLLSTTYDPTECLATKTCTGGTFTDPTPTGCTPTDCTQSDQNFKCNCKPGFDPVGCICPSDSSQLTGISTTACPCRSTADPRAGGTCSPYCTGPGEPIINCVCNTNPDQTTGYPLSDCQASKVCTGTNIPEGCTPTCTPDSGGSVQQNTCFCTNTNHPTDCRCPIDPQDLVDILTSRCECLPSGDPRAGSQTIGAQCPITRVCQLNDDLTTPCLCSSDFSGVGCTCTSTYSQEGCVCDLLSTTYNPTTCLATKLCTGGTFTDPTPSGCTPPDCSPSSQTFKCNCKNGFDPVGCVCPEDSQDLTGISPQACECISTGDIRAGDTCPITRKCKLGSVETECLCSGSYSGVGCICSLDYHPQNCICDDISGAEFGLEECQKSKKCTSTNTPVNCTPDCLETTGQTVQTDQCMCSSNDHSPTGCRCPPDWSQLSRIPTSRCPCVEGDIRSTSSGGPLCPIYCTQQYHYQDCICSLDNSTDLNIQECRVIKLCTGGTFTDPTPYGCKISDCKVTNQDYACICNEQIHPDGCITTCNAPSDTSVTEDSCICTTSNHPVGCRCPDSVEQLVDIPVAQCPCRSINDPRQGTLCPRYCTDEVHPPECICNEFMYNSFTPNNCNFSKVCDINHEPKNCQSLCNASSSDPISYPETCICNQDYSPSGCRCAQGEYLTGLPNTTCPCVEGDIRAGTGECPSLCTITSHPQDCTCPIDDESFTLEQCRATKTCTAGNNPYNYRPLGCSLGQCTAVDQDYGCICTTAFHPPGCTCPTDLDELKVFDIAVCPCVEKDKRSTIEGGNLCPANCTFSNFLTNNCLCNSEDQSYDLEVCRKAKICSAQNVPEGCTPICQAGQFPETHNCVCAGSDTVCLQGRQPCTGYSYPNLLPLGCYEVGCSPSQQQNCICVPGSDQSGCSCSKESYPQNCSCGILQNVDLSTLQCFALKVCISFDWPPGCTDYCTYDTDLTVLKDSCFCNGFDHSPTGCLCPSYDILNDQTPTDRCPCLPSGDPRAGSQIVGAQCPAYCQFADYPPNCICDPRADNSFPYQECLASKPCTGGNFTDPTPTGCTPVACESSTQGFPCICTSSNSPPGCTPNCTTGSDPSLIPCMCKSTDQPSNCICPTTDPTQLAGILQGQCACLPSGDPRADGMTCPLYCQSKELLTPQCQCDTKSATYLPETCLIDKLCKYDLVHQSEDVCPCVANDPRAGQACPVTEDCISGILEPQDRGCFCTAIYQPSGCTCSSTVHPPQSNCLCDQHQSASYDLTTCRSSKTCNSLDMEYNPYPPGCTPYCADDSSSEPPTNCVALDCQISSTSSACKCTPSLHPSGCQCSSDYSDQQCTCGVITQADIQLEQCKKNKFCTDENDPEGCTPLCTSADTGPVIQDSCICSGQFNPLGCKCPKDPEMLLTMSTTPCTCIPGDWREECGGPPLCLPNNHQPNNCRCTPLDSPVGCTCPTDPSQLAGIPTSACPCLATGDPRTEC